ncbi:MAG: iron-containing alcohol dehydrogenase, partial [Clostridia bacterium]|nr:iron-containing alcohol dehydrogenase [Clostridia bacterium]
DPEYTYTVNKWQTACGTADAINHVLEQFFASPHSAFNDGVMISALRSLMDNVKIALEKPDDYAARSELMYVCSWGCNGILSNGAGYSGWPMHSIEHALSAYFDITHGAGLAIITPRWMVEILSEKTLERFVTLGTMLFGIDKNLPGFEIAEKVINGFYAFFESTGIPMHLGELGVKAEAIDEMADHILEYDSTNEPWMYAPIGKDALIRILTASM